MTAKNNVSIEEARQVLGNSAKTIFDVQISDILAFMQLMADNYLDVFKRSLTLTTK